MYYQCLRLCIYFTVGIGVSNTVFKSIIRNNNVYTYNGWYRTFSNVLLQESVAFPLKDKHFYSTVNFVRWFCRTPRGKYLHNTPHPHITADCKPLFSKLCHFFPNILDLRWPLKPKRNHSSFRAITCVYSDNYWVVNIMYI